MDSKSPIASHLALATTTMLVAVFLTLAACSPTQLPPPPPPVLAAIQACSSTWGGSSEMSAKVSASYEKLKASGEADWKIIVETGGTVMNGFKDEPTKLKVYEAYIACMKPTLDKFASADQRPKVVLIGSREDYTTYHLSELEATSTELLNKRFGVTFNTVPITVSPGWSDEDFVRRQDPQAVVMHASAFHQEEHKDEAVEKSHAIVESFMSLPKVKMIVFSRVPPDHPAPDLCSRWKRQVDFLTSDRLKGHVFFYPLSREESNFSGAAGIELSQILRCETGLDATEFCNVYLRERLKDAQKRIAESSCATPSG